MAQDAVYDYIISQSMLLSAQKPPIGRTAPPPPDDVAELLKVHHVGGSSAIASSHGGQLLSGSAPNLLWQGEGWRERKVSTCTLNSTELGLIGLQAIVSHLERCLDVGTATARRLGRVERA